MLVQKSTPLQPNYLLLYYLYFQLFEVISVDTSVDQEVAAHFSVFTIPTVLIFLDGKEFLRKSRHMSVGEVIEEIRRPYEIMIS
jgi:thiol-disulfide isomerase/thioredoxin